MATMGDSGGAGAGSRRDITRFEDCRRPAGILSRPSTASHFRDAGRNGSTTKSTKGTKLGSILAQSRYCASCGHSGTEPTCPANSLLLPPIRKPLACGIWQKAPSFLVFDPHRCTGCTGFFRKRLASIPGHPQPRTGSSPKSPSCAGASRPAYPVHPVNPCWFFYEHGCTGYTGLLSSTALPR